MILILDGSDDGDFYTEDLYSATERYSMANWVLVPCLAVLLDEFNEIAPLRSRRSDGTIGDPAHAQRSSDHNPDETGKTPHEDSDTKNEVHALDVTAELHSKEFKMEDVIQFILSECRKTVGLDRGRLKNIIYNRRIWSASWGWEQRPFIGDNPHVLHAHFSAEYDSEFSEDTSSWGLVEKFGDDMGTVDRISPDAIRQIVNAATLGVLTYGSVGPDGKEEGGIPDLPGQTDTNVLNLITAIYEHVRDLSEAVDTQATVIDDLLAKINQLIVKGDK